MDSDAKSRLAEMGEDYVRIVEESEKETVRRQTLPGNNRRVQQKFPVQGTAEAQRQFRQYAMKPKTPNGMRVYRHMWGPSEFTCTGILKDMDITAKLPQIKVRVRS